MGSPTRPSLVAPSSVSVSVSPSDFLILILTDKTNFISNFLYLKMTERFFSTFNFNRNTFEITFILLFILPLFRQNSSQGILFSKLLNLFCFTLQTPVYFCQIFNFWFSPFCHVFTRLGGEVKPDCNFRKPSDHPKKCR